MRNLAVCGTLLLLAAIAPRAGAGTPLNAAWALGMLMVMAVIGQRLAMRLRLPPVCGWLAAGLILGPSGLDAVRPGASEGLGGGVGGLYVVHAFTAVWLAFEVGLSLEWTAIRRTWAIPGTVALSTIAALVFTTLGAVGLVGLAWEPALLIGALGCLWGPFIASGLLRSEEAVLVGAIGSGVGLLALSAVLVLLHAQHFVPTDALVAVGRFWASLAAGALAVELLWRVRSFSRRTPTIVTLVGASILAAVLVAVGQLYALPLGFGAGLVLAAHEESSHLLRHLVRPARRLAAMVFFGLAAATLDLGSTLWPPTIAVLEIVLIQVVVLILLRGVGPAIWFPEREVSGASRHRSWLLLPKGALIFELVFRPSHGLAGFLPADSGRLVVQLATAEVLVFGLVFAALAATAVRLFGQDEPAPAI